MNPEQKAIAKLNDRKLYELQAESQQLSEDAIHHRLSHGQRVHRRRVTSVLRQKEEQSRTEQLAREQHQARPEMQMPNQARYDEAYDRGNIDYQMSRGYGAARFTTPLQRSAYEDGYFCLPRRRVY